MKQRGLHLFIIAIILTLAEGSAFAFNLPVITKLPSKPTVTASTIPANGDLNPYGVAFVPDEFPEWGVLAAGDLLVSNFNDKSNTQGTGTTIVQIAPDGAQSLFFEGKAGLGLTTALGVLKAGVVLVGNVPSPKGACSGVTEKGVGQGSLLVLDRNGDLVKTLTSKAFLDGPWYLTINDNGSTAQVFVSDVLSGTVTRIDLQVVSEGSGKDSVDVLKETQIASGYNHQCNSAALVVGPTGLAYDKSKDILYVASTGDNKIFAVANAGKTTKDLGTGTVIVSDTTHLHGPLGLLLAPNGDLISSQGDAVNEDSNHVNEIVEFTSKGKFVAQVPIEPKGAGPGAAFGIALSTSENGVILAAVDDIANAVDVWLVQ